MKRNGCEIARHNELAVLKALHKYAWLRTRDLAALLWMKVKASPGREFTVAPLMVEASPLRMAQRTLSRLRTDRQVIWRQAPDGSLIFGLAEAGSRRLVSLGIPAKSGKDQVRRVSLSQYHHRRLANEIAILASLQKFRVSSESEIAAGLWLGGLTGINGKKPDVVVRDGKKVWWVEVERSRRNQRDYQKLLSWLNTMWPTNRHNVGPANLPGGHILEKVLFVCEGAFINRLITGLRDSGWSAEQIERRISAIRLLYVTEAKFILKSNPNAGTVGVTLDC